MSFVESPITILEASALEPYRLVKFTTAGNPPTATYAAAGGDFHAVTRDRPNSSAEESPFAVRARLKTDPCIQEICASGAITALAPVYADANGKITATSQGPVIGYALTAAAADGDVIDVVLATSIIVVNQEYLAASVTKAGFVASGPMRVVKHTGRVTAAGTDGSAVTAAVYKAPSGMALGSGTSTMASTMNLKGTANTNQALAVSATAADNLLAAGDALGLVFSGTLTSATGVITTILVPV